MVLPFVYIIVVLAQLGSLHAQPDVNCPPGQVSKSGRCEPCPAGTFRFVNASNNCVPCPGGTFSPITGLGSRILCRFCTTNTFSEPGSSRCTPCPEGTVADRRASRCLACGPGFGLDRGRCRPCPPTTFNSMNATIRCQSCPFPLTSPRQSTNASACRPCPRGREGSMFSGCSLCPAGTFKPGRMGDCRQCLLGSVSSRGAVACMQCPAGTFSARRFAESCTSCPGSTTSNGPGATQCRRTRSASCPSTTFENANGDCEMCRPQFRYNKETKMCEPCPSGTVSMGGLQTECTACPPGQTPGQFSGDCRCPQGMFDEGKKCRPCPPGTGGNFVNVIGRSSCIDCDIGTFSNRPGMTRCTPCPFGTFSDEEGATRCKRCPSGSVPNRVTDLEFPGSTRCVSIATGCPLGTQPARDVFDRITCRRVDCLVGTPEEDIGIKCSPCMPGTRLVGERCQICPIDAVSDGGVITSCTQCENGMFRSFFDASKCACDGTPAIGKGIQDGVCQDCPPGSIGDSNSSECVKCPKGSFASGFGSGSCTPCPRRTFSEEEGSPSCKRCPRRQIPEAITGSTECVPVLRGEIIA